MTDFYDNKYAKQMEQIRKNFNMMNNEWTRTAMQLTDSLRPIREAQLKLAESFRPIYEAQFKLAESFRPIYEAQFKLAESFRSIHEAQFKLAESFRPMEIISQVWQNQFTESFKTIQPSLAMNAELVESFQKIANLGNSLAIGLQPFNNIVANFSAVHQEQMQRIFASVNQASFNFDFTNIDFDRINDLYANINIGTEATLEWTDVELQEMQDAISESTDGSIFNFTAFLNKLTQLASENRKFLFVLSFLFVQIVIPYFNNVIAYIYPPESIALFRELRSERLQQVSQQIINTLPPNEVKESKIVRVRELNVRSEPNIDAVITGWIYFGSNVKVIKTDGEWTFVKWNGIDGIGIQGWVNKRYLSEVNAPSVE